MTNSASSQRYNPQMPAARKILGLLLLGASLAFLRTSATLAQQSATSFHPATPDAHAVLVELFTSEGCSSCPPADLLLQKLDEFQPIAGAHLIVLSEHVTYWDHDGWKDPNSSDAFTQRQGSYESALGVRDLYTPQFVVDGTQEASLSVRGKIEEVLKKAATTPKLGVRIGDLTVDAGVLRAHVETDSNFTKHNADVFVALAANRVESQVLRGENGGKHLVHVAVVRQLLKVGKLPKEKAFSQDVQLKLKPGEDFSNLRVIVFAQESGGKVLGAAEQNLKKM